MKYEQKELKGLKMTNNVLAWSATISLVAAGIKLSEKQRKEVEEWNRKIRASHK
jgi:hypothetical protein